MLIAGGVGITPMMSAVRSLTDRCWSGEIYLLFSVRTLRDLTFGDELGYLQARFPNLHVRVTITGEPGGAPGGVWDGTRGQISLAMIESFVPRLLRGPVLVCGPDAMMTAVRRLLVDQIGIPDAEVLQEAFVSPPSAADGAGASSAADRETLSALPAGDGTAANVKFQRAGKVAELTPGSTVLEAAEDVGVAIPFECRSGICGQCKTRLVSGTITMAVQDALTPADRSNQLILACQAHAIGDVVIDA